MPNWRACDGRRNAAPWSGEEGFLAGDALAPDLALGMRRLSIIDLAGGQQPVWNETRDSEANNVTY
jgi:asparagine synthetase B (glutamine-hydrolysing)